MAGQSFSAQSLSVYRAICSHFDGRNWTYNAQEDELKIALTVRGDDLPIDLNIRILDDRKLVLLLSHLPFIIPEDKRVEVAIAVSIVNDLFVDGSFDFDFTDGHMFFRMTTSFMESAISDEVIRYIINVSAGMIDKFNDKFLMMSKGMLSLEQFMDSIKG